MKAVFVIFKVCCSCAGATKESQKIALKPISGIFTLKFTVLTGAYRQSKVKMGRSYEVDWSSVDTSR
jgi:hypothetical protein